jgi:hypothetical protein
MLSNVAAKSSKFLETCRAGEDPVKAWCRASAAEKNTFSLNNDTKANFGCERYGQRMQESSDDDYEDFINHT